MQAASASAAPARLPVAVLGMVSHDTSYPRAPRRFVLDRIEDQTGLSGTGIVAWGIQFPDGHVVTRWCSSELRQTCVWDSIADVQRVHGHGGRTKVRWLDEPWQVIAPTQDRTFPLAPVPPIPLRPNPSAVPL